MKIACVYIFPGLAGPTYDFYAHRFVDSYLAHPPLLEHDTIIVCNGHTPRKRDVELFSKIPGDVTFFVHDNSGLDIGGFQAVAKVMPHDWAVWFGASTYFHRKGWLVRYQEAWNWINPGLYANSSHDSPRPHVRTTGFVCSPMLIRSYPKRVITGGDRYDFEHGPDSLTMRAAHSGVNVALVTWDGLWLMDRWREPANIYQKGDRTNCLVWDRMIV